MYCDSNLISTHLCACNYDHSSIPICPNVSPIKPMKIYRNLTHKSTCSCNYNPFNDETKDNEINDLGFALRKIAAMKCQMKKWQIKRLQLESETRSLKKRLKKFDVNVEEPLEEDPLLIHYRDENIRLEKNKEQLEDKINELEELVNEQESFKTDSSAGIQLIREKMHALRRDHKKLKKTIMEMKTKFLENDESSCVGVRQLCVKIRELTNELEEKKIIDKGEESAVEVDKLIEITNTHSKSYDDLQDEIVRIKEENQNLRRALETRKNDVDKSKDDEDASGKVEESSGPKRQIVFDSVIDNESTLEGKLMKCNELVVDLRGKLDEKDEIIQDLQKKMFDMIGKMKINDKKLFTEVDKSREELKNCEERVKEILKQLEQSSLDLKSHDMMKESQLTEIKNERDKLLNEVNELREVIDKNSQMNKILDEKDEALSDKEANNAVLRDKIDALLSQVVLRDEIDQLREQIKMIRNPEEQNSELVSMTSNIEEESIINEDEIDSEHEISSNDLDTSNEEMEALRHENEMHLNEKKELEKQLSEIQTKNHNCQDELNKCKNDNDKLNEMIITVRSELSDCNSEKEQLQLRISQLESSNDESKNNALSELKISKNELDQLSKKFDKAQKDNEDLTSERNILKDKVVEIQKQLSKENTDKDDLKKSIEKSMIELNLCQLDNGTLKTKNNQLKQDIDNCKKEINNGKLEYDKLKEELENTIKELELTHELINKNHDDKLSKSKDSEVDKSSKKPASNNITEDVALNKINDLNEELDALKSELTKCRDENAKLRNNLDESKQQQTQLNSDVENSKNEIAALKVHCEELKGENKLENDELKAEGERLRNENSNLKIDLFNMKKSNENLTSEIDTLKSNLSKCHSERDDLALELVKLKDEYNKNENELHGAATELKKSKEALDKSEHQAHSLELNLNALKDEKESLLKTLSSLRKEVDTLKRNAIVKDNELKESQATKHELIALKKELKKCREELDRCNRENGISEDGLNIAVEKIQTEKQHKDIENDCDELKKQLEESKINIDELKAEILTNNISMEEMDALKNTLGELRNDLEKCKMENDGFKSEVNKWQSDSIKSNTELEVKALEEKIDDLNHKVNEMKLHNNKLEEELRNKHGDMENKIMEYNKLKADNAKLKIENDKLLSKYDDEMTNEMKKFADDEVNNFEKEIERLKAENDEIKDELQTVRNKLNSSLRYNEGAMMIDADKSRDEALESEETSISLDVVKILMQKNNELANNLEKLNSDINKCENENKILKANVSELNKWQKIAENLQKQNDRLDKNLQAINQELTKAKHDAKNMSGRNDNLNTETLMESTQSKDVEQWQKKVKELTAEIERLNKEHVISTRIEDGQSSMQQLLDELDKCKKTVKNLREENNKMKSEFDKIQVDKNRLKPSIESRRPSQTSKERPDAPVHSDIPAMSNELTKTLGIIRIKMEKQSKGVQRMRKNIDNMLKQIWSESSEYTESEDTIVLDTMNPIIAEVLELSNDLSTNIFTTEKELMNLGRMWKAQWDENVKLQKLVENLGNAETIQTSELQDENVGRNIVSFDSESWLSIFILQSLTLTQLADLHDKICLLTTSLVCEDCTSKNPHDNTVSTSYNQLQHSYDALNRKIAALQRQIAEKQTEAEKKVLDMRQTLRREQAELIKISKAMNQEKKRNLKLHCIIDESSLSPNSCKTGTECGKNAELTVVYEDVIFPIINEKYFGMVDVFLTEDNLIAGNFSIKQSLPESAICHLYMLGDSMGEYVVPSGLDAEMTLCEMINEPIVLGSVLKVFGFDKDECPPKSGFYGNEGYKIPTENFPDSFTPNKYLFILELYTPDEPIITLHLTLNVQL
ncbi:hypothetical protein PV327_000611 [Microctonus hyperodae]|uniref:Uncharacterized protein n=1 Tax=Microctonus hyperodae TaxID=165561 RepID=A0AA39L2J1_MICHY|nr:hypothetical protein PV327_000611 [Microctonus hyperodae]